MWSLKNHEMRIENFFKSNFQKLMTNFKISLVKYSDKSLPVGNT